MSVRNWNTKICCQTSWHGSNFHRKKIAKQTFRVLFLRFNEGKRSKRLFFVKFWRRKFETLQIVCLSALMSRNAHKLSRRRNNLRMSQKDARNTRNSLEILILITNDHWLWFQRDLLVLIVILMSKTFKLKYYKET